MAKIKLTINLDDFYVNLSVSYSKLRAAIIYFIVLSRGTLLEEEL